MGPDVERASGSISVGSSLTGDLVVATHGLTAGIFRRAVVLVLAHDDEQGAAGVILNRPTSADLPDRLRQWTALIAPPAVFAGGPVGHDTLIAIGRAFGDVTFEGWQPIAEGVGVVDLSSDIAAARAQLHAVRLFVGHAGWEAGQLEREIASGAWFVVDGHPDDALASAPEVLWRAVLARQGGLFTTIPDDPASN